MACTSWDPRGCDPGLHCLSLIKVFFFDGASGPVTATEPMGMGLGVLVAGLPWTLVHGAGQALALHGGHCPGLRKQKALFH